MQLSYFPGCSLKGTGRAYEESLLEVFSALGIELREIDDWNCCGATAYMSIDEEQALALAARNLALAEKADRDLVVPCSGCYLVLNKTHHRLEGYPSLKEGVTRQLAACGLNYRGSATVRHPLDVLANDVGVDAIRARVSRPLKDLKAASYYGCQIVRPWATFDCQARPVAMDRLLEAIGMTVVHYPLKTRCCGGSMTGTTPDVGRELVRDLAREAARQGADLIATVCPLCQFNLDAYQDPGEENGSSTVPVVYFTQLIGLAFGIDPDLLGLQRNIIKPRRLLEQCAAAV